MVYNPQNIFSRILRQEIPCTKVYEDEHVLAFRDISPKKPVHVLIIPKGPFVSFSDFTEKAGVDAVGRFFTTAGHIARDILKLENGYRIIANTGEDGGQEVPHFHLHILAGAPVGPMICG